MLPAGANDKATLTAAGSTFVEPLLRRWIDAYKAVAPGVTINYEGVGSPAGVDRLKAGQGDFFTSDMPLSQVEEATEGGAQEFYQLPWAAGAIALPYNLPDVPVLQLAPDTVGAIFAGRVQRWDDPFIRRDNPDVRLPSTAITLVYRTEASGTTAVFTAYLEAASYGQWSLGTSRTSRFPRGQGARGSEGVANAVKATTGAIGYTQLGLAEKAGLKVVSLGNRANRFIQPTPEAVNAAMAGALLREHGTTATLYFTPEAPAAYPLATLSYLIYRRTGLDEAKAAALRHFASWALTEGQRFAENLGYAPVPRQFVPPALSALDRS